MASRVRWRRRSVPSTARLGAPAKANALVSTRCAALRGLSQSAQGVPQDGQQAMNPIVGLRLTQLKLQPVHDLQRVGLLVDHDEQEFVFKARQGPFCATASTA